jgi:hypothetical protein
MMYFKLFGKLFLSVLPHFNIAMAVTMLVLYVTDQYNRAMAFINNDITKGMLAVFCVTVCIEAITMSVMRRKAAYAKNQQIDVQSSETEWNGDQ